MSYRAQRPEADENSYAPGGNDIRFVLKYPGEKFMVNSFRFEGKVNVQDNGAPLENASPYVSLDPTIGAHSFIESIHVRFQSFQGMSPLMEYAQFMRALTDCTTDEDDFNNSKYVTEMRTGNLVFSEFEVIPILPKGSTHHDTVLPDFSIKPYCELNNAISEDGTLSDRKYGWAEVIIKLRPAVNVFHGLDMPDTVNLSYTIDNPLARFETVPDDGIIAPVVFNTYQSTPYAITSNTQNVQADVADMCDAVSCVFIKNSDKTNPDNIVCKTDTQRLPGLKKVVFSIKNVLNQMVDYELTQQAEINQRYIESFPLTGTNSCFGIKQYANKSNGVGIRFPQSLNLKSLPFQMQLVSDVTNLEPYQMTMFFHKSYVL
jgi:hypothetical protein